MTLEASTRIKNIQLNLCKMKRTAWVFCLCLGFVFSKAQTIQNLNAAFTNGKATITYDVAGAKPDQTFSLDLFSSHDNFTAPLKLVTGDVGKNIRAGLGKRITWDAAAELVTYSGQITFKVKGEMNALPFLIKNPTQNGKATRGKKLNVAWEGGRPDQNVRLQVFKGTDAVADLGESKNTGQYTWSIPKDFSKGTYSIKLSAGQETKQSGFFTVKSKSLVMIIVLPVVAVGVVVAVLAGGGEKSSLLPQAPDPN